MRARSLLVFGLFVGGATLASPPGRAAAQVCGGAASGSARLGSGEGVLGLVNGLTAALGGPRCPGGPTHPAALDMQAQRPTTELAPQLEESFELEEPFADQDRDLGDSLTRQLLGGPDLRRGWWAESLGDALGLGVVATQLVLDLTLPLRRERHADAVWQILLVDGLAHALAQGATALIAQLSDDERPAEQCDGSDCESEGPLSPSGRATLTFTSASLMCLHGQMNGDSPAACLTGAAAAALAGTMWGLSDDHRWQDVLGSAGVGLLAGYVLPWMTFYGFGERNPLAPSARESDDVQVWVSPDFSSRGAGLSLQGTF